MLTPARRHFMRAQAAKNASHAATGKVQTGDQYELMQAALWESRRSLKGIKSIEGKVARKRELLPQFFPYIEGVLKAGAGAQDDVLMTVMVWLFDVGDFLRAGDIAEYALKHSLTTPDHYERDTASLYAEQVADECLKTLAELEKIETEEEKAAAENTARILLDALTRAEQLTAKADMHDQIRAKLHKATGYANRIAGRTEEALNHLNRALQLNDRVGVKKDIEKLERELKKQNAGTSES